MSKTWSKENPRNEKSYDPNTDPWMTWQEQYHMSAAIQRGYFRIQNGSKGVC